MLKINQAQLHMIRSIQDNFGQNQVLHIEKDKSGGVGHERGKKTRCGDRVKLSISATRIRAEVLTNIFEFTEADAAITAHIHRLIVFVDEVITVDIVGFHNALPVFKHSL